MAKKPKSNVSTVRARVRVLIEIDAPGAWGGDCSVDQVTDQAKEEVLNRIRGGLVINGLTNKSQQKTAAKIIGPMEVEVMTFFKDRELKDGK